jgi:hypothetical protein
MASIDVAEVEDPIGSAHHKAGVLIGLLSSPRGRKKFEIMKGIAESLFNDTGTLYCAVMEARYQERLEAQQTSDEPR